MAEMRARNLLRSQAASVELGGVLDCGGYDAVFVELVVTSGPSPVVVGHVTLENGVLPPLAAFGGLCTTADVTVLWTGTGIAWSAGEGRWNVTSPTANATTTALVRLNRPAKYLRPIWTYSSGATSEFVITVNAWGFGVGT